MISSRRRPDRTWSPPRSEACRGVSTRHLHLEWVEDGHIIEMTSNTVGEGRTDPARPDHGTFMRRGIVVVALLLGAAVGDRPPSFAAPSTVALRHACRPADHHPPDNGHRTHPHYLHRGRFDPHHPTRSHHLPAWWTGGLSADLVAGLRGPFDQVSIVKGDVVELDQSGGWVIPLDALAIPPNDHAPFDPNGTSTGSELGRHPRTSSARLRKTQVGDTLTLNGTSFVGGRDRPDATVAAAEVVFDQANPNLPSATDRYALVASDLPHNKLQRRIRALYDGPAPLRIRSVQETPWLRHGDAVFPQVFIKQALGEFAYTNRNGSTFDEDSAFVDQNILTPTSRSSARSPATEPSPRCSPAPSTGSRDGLSHLVDPAGSPAAGTPAWSAPSPAHRPDSPVTPRAPPSTSTPPPTNWAPPATRTPAWSRSCRNGASPGWRPDRSRPNALRIR